MDKCGMSEHKTAKGLNKNDVPVVDSFWNSRDSAVLGTTSVSHLVAKYSRIIVNTSGHSQLFCVPYCGYESVTATSFLLPLSIRRNAHGTVSNMVSEKALPFLFAYPEFLGCAATATPKQAGKYQFRKEE